MSTNGAGKLLAEIRAGRRPPMDKRNRLIIPTMDVAVALKPRWIILENVPAMKDTIILDRDGKAINIIEFVKRELGSSYVGASEVVSCSDYGIPQVRRRLITVFTRDPEGTEYFRRNGGTFFSPEDRRRPQTLREAIGHLPKLDPVVGPLSRTDYHPMHYVQKMAPEKHWWIENTPEGATAFNNQCVAPHCGYSANPVHVDRTATERASLPDLQTLLCKKCGSLLPRPTMVDDQTGKRRLIKGFHSAYRRMRWDEPAHALTRNFPFEASDNKIHPQQHRPLSIYEAMVLQTIADYDFVFEGNGKVAGRKLIADIIGESVPPRLIDIITRKIIKHSRGFQAGPKSTSGAYAA